MIRFFDGHEIRIDRLLSDRGTEHCGAHDRHEHERCLAVENIDHATTKVKSPPANGIRDRFNKTLPDEPCRITLRKNVYDTAEARQPDMDGWITIHDGWRTHQGRWCFGKTPLQTFLDAANVAREKQNPARAA